MLRSWWTTNCGHHIAELHALVAALPHVRQTRVVAMQAQVVCTERGYR